MDFKLFFVAVSDHFHVEQLYISDSTDTEFVQLITVTANNILQGPDQLGVLCMFKFVVLFQISDVVVPGQEDITAKDALLLWSRRTTEGYPGVKIRDFSSSWRDGKAFLSILHRNRYGFVLVVIKVDSYIIRFHSKNMRDLIFIKSHL